MHKTISLLAAAALATIAGGCANDGTYGVDVVNKTGQILNVTYFDVAADGTAKPYSTTTLAKKGTLTNKVPHDQQGYGKRIRFSIPDRAADDPGANVELKLSDEKVRDYDLLLVNGRLVAREHTKGRPDYEQD